MHIPLTMHCIVCMEYAILPWQTIRCCLSYHDNAYLYAFNALSCLPTSSLPIVYELNDSMHSCMADRLQFMAMLHHHTMCIRLTHRWVTDISTYICSYKRNEKACMAFSRPIQHAGHLLCNVDRQEHAESLVHFITTSQQ